MTLSASERETVIVFNDADDSALVTTAQRPVITKLKKNPAAVMVEEGRVGRSRWATFEIPKSFISFRSKQRRFSAQENGRRAAHLATVRDHAVDGDNTDPNHGSSDSRKGATDDAQ
jgi:hypothetical protein